VSNQPVEDRRRALGPSAGGARGPAPALSSTAKLFVVTGPSGAGKGTLIKGVLARRSDLALAVSATTRQRRDGEVEGRDYYFLSEDDFLARVESGEFLEHVVYVSGRYGTLRSEVERIFESGRSCVLELETVGARNVQDASPEAVTIFIAAPSFEELERRLRERATESSGVIEERLEVARRQMEEASLFGHVVINDDVERAVDELDKIVTRALTTTGRPSPT
jgi:guanylate kinase